MVRKREIEREREREREMESKTKKVWIEDQRLQNLPGALKTYRYCSAPEASMFDVITL